ncbi:2-C-methyl-D-erythritol 4-phosphate cytidylyltransferase [Pseudidiomarina insulisalsae]|uniref:2-C-methyl-D-erythritol 4-phosphate cytidylyltransferase n=1 Tax=Pseudidiomarina insulisalsae TaxID=575789 RepID=A0A432YA72_9GAMM|nr:2-C-methyl-D-erythritol 4-phosphate cytidylyltransferase [Pseudidiomarina insulisalsae]RUO57868.1 2-C-methyl-D-erythritol 4-phosphate cytidylyltransferase [Pseudidiomarina insulisalsae]
MTRINQVAAVVPAAGVGSRMQSACPKQYLSLNGETVLQHSVKALSQDPRITHIYIAVSADDPYFASQEFANSVQITRVTGGASRAASVQAGVAAAVADGYDWVAVHDAARPCLSATELSAVLDGALADPVGALLALPVADTLKRADSAQRSGATVARDGLWQALTPQVFRSRQLLTGLEQLGADNPQLTDEASVLEAIGQQPRLIQGKRSNIKITLPGDEQLAQLWLQATTRDS